MIRKVLAIISLCVGLFASMLWGVASHGNIDLSEDWIIFIVIIGLFIPSIIYIFRYLKKT